MGKSNAGGKGGGARKYGRNKKKCEVYRLRHKILGSKKPKGYSGGNGHRVMDLITLSILTGDGDKTIEFKPVTPRDHLCTELFETGHKTPAKVAEMKDSARELSRHLLPSLKQRVLIVPKPPEKK